MSIKHLFILNPKSFWNKWKWDQVILKIQSFFEDAGENNYLLHVSRFPREAISFIHSFAQTLPKETTLRVYAVGGDGIVFDCLNGIMGLERAELAIMPYGHTNDFVRVFGRKSRTKFRKMERQFLAPVIPMDVIRIGKNHALNYCTIGLEAAAVRRSGHIRENFEKGNLLSQWINRWLYTINYIVGGMIAGTDKNLMRQRYTVNIDGEILKGAYSTIAIFNGAYYGGEMYPFENSVPNDGILDIILTRSVGFIRTFSLLPFYMTNRSRLFPRIFIPRQGRKISVNSKDPILLSLDGEVYFDNNITLELLPGALQFVNAGFNDESGSD
jgi:diacylglycerol kinase family enzyme